MLNHSVTVGDPPVRHMWPDFVRYVSGLLGAGRTLRRLPDPRDPAVGGDLILLQDCDAPWLKRALGATATNRLVAQVEAPVLIARQPRFPFCRMLLVLRDEPSDSAAISWALHLARASGAGVTILPVVPSLPILYVLGSRGQPQLDVLLAPNTAIGSKIRHVAASLKEARVPYGVRQQQGAPDWQIRQEMLEGDHDLLVVGADSGGRLYRWFVGELVRPLLCWCARPVLIASIPCKSSLATACE